MPECDSRDGNIKKAVSDGLSLLKIEEPLSCSEWADRHFYLSEESSSISGPWESLPYQVAILDWLGDDDIEVLDFLKSARVGYTKMLCANVGYKIEHKKRKVVIYQPTDTDAKDFVKDEIDPMLRDVPIVGDILRGEPDKKSPHNKADRKSFLNGSILHIRGGKTGTNYRRITVDEVLYDELGGFDHDVDNEGSPLILGDMRLETSSFPKSIRGTTPKLKQFSLIEESIENADMVFRRYLPCPECGEYFRLSKDIFDLEDPKTIDSDKFPCEECGVEIGYEHYPEMDKHGRWMTENGEYYDEELRIFFSHEDEKIHAPRHIGVEIWAAYSYFKTWADLFYRWNRAVKEYKTKGDNTKLKTFINTSLGEGYEEKGERISENALNDRLEDYGEIIPSGVLFITMAVDVQGGKNSRLEVEICGWGIGEESWSLDYFKIYGETERQEVWDHLDEQRARTFRREDGMELSISIVVIDSGYLQETVFKYTKPREKYRVYAIKGDPLPGKQLVGKYSLLGPKKNIRCYLLGVNRGKDKLYTRLKFDKPEDGEPREGYCHFPKRYGDIYFKGLLSEEKRRDKKDPRKFRYHKIHEDAPNEPLDLKVYNMAALAIANPNFALLKRKIDRMVEAINHNIVTEPLVMNRGRRVRSRGVAV